MVADAAYHDRKLKDLPEHVTWTTRLRRNAVRYDRARNAPGNRVVPG